MFIGIFLDSFSEEVDSVWEGVSFDLVELFPCLLDLILYIVEYSLEAVGDLGRDRDGNAFCFGHFSEYLVPGDGIFSGVSVHE